jgi:hypothetical protein
MLEMDKAGIAVAEYWTTMPPKALFEEKIRSLLAEAQERLERRKSLPPARTRSRLIISTNPRMTTRTSECGCGEMSTKIPRAKVTIFRVAAICSSVCFGMALFLSIFFQFFVELRIFGKKSLSFSFRSPFGAPSYLFPP